MPEFGAHAARAGCFCRTNSEGVVGIQWKNHHARIIILVCRVGWMIGHRDGCKHGLPVLRRCGTLESGTAPEQGMKLAQTPSVVRCGVGGRRGGPEVVFIPGFQKGGATKYGARPMNVEVPAGAISAPLGAVMTGRRQRVFD